VFVVKYDRIFCYYAVWFICFALEDKHFRYAPNFSFFDLIFFYHTKHGTLPTELTSPRLGYNIHVSFLGIICKLFFVYTLLWQNSRKSGESRLHNSNCRNSNTLNLTSQPSLTQNRGKPRPQKCLTEKKERHVTTLALHSFRLLHLHLPVFVVQQIFQVFDVNYFNYSMISS